MCSAHENMLHLTQAGEANTNIEDIWVCVCVHTYMYICIHVCIYSFLSKMCPQISVKTFYTFAFEAQQWGLRWERREGVLCGMNKWHCLKEYVHIHRARCCLYYTLTLQTTGTTPDGYLPKALLLSRLPYWYWRGCQSGFCSTCPWTISSYLSGFFIFR